MGFKERLSQFAHAWNAFNQKDKTTPDWSVGPTTNHSYFSYAPYRTRLSYVNSKTIIAPVLNRIALDCAAVDIKHVKVDPMNPDGYLYDMDSMLNRCLTLEANRDQSAADFWVDVFLNLLDKGEIAIVPTDLTCNPTNSNAWDVEKLRVGSIIQWRPQDVLVYVYNEDRGERQEVWMPKKAVAIVQNPFYTVMNEQASVLSRLTKKLAILDQVDEQSGSGKLDLIIQLPYAIKSDLRQQQADERRAALEAQLANNKLGVGYIDSTEKITQLNRSLENNLLEQVQYLTDLLYSQLGITAEILNSTAEEEVMLNYMNRTIAPIINAVTNELTRKFITKTAYTQGQRVKYFSDPFKLVSMTSLSDIADKLTRNEIASTNEIRTKFLGWRPVESDQANELRNKNLNITEGQTYALTDGGAVVEKDDPEQLAAMNGMMPGTDPMMDTGMASEIVPEAVPESGQSDLDQLQALLVSGGAPNQEIPIEQPVEENPKEQLNEVISLLEQGIQNGPENEREVPYGRV